MPGGVTQPAFQKLGESENVYLCLCCMSVKQSSEISNLTSIINELHSAFTALTARHFSPPSLTNHLQTLATNYLQISAITVLLSKNPSLTKSIR